MRGHLVVGVVLAGLLVSACAGPPVESPTASPAAPSPAGSSTARSPADPGPSSPPASSSPASSSPGSSSPTPSPPRPDLTSATVVVDPGHNGGTDTAAIGRLVPDGRGGEKPCNTTGASTADGYPEHAFTWDVAGRLADALRARGARVVLTRSSDDGDGPCVDERGAAGERAHADAVVSVHADGGPASGHGFHVLYSAPPLHPSQGAPSRTLATSAVDAFRRAGFVPADYIGRDGLDARADIAGLNLATVPSVLVECGNLRNAGDAATARSAAGRDRYARALADAVTSWLAAHR